MGIITEATVRAVPLPEREAFRGVFFPDFERGMDAVRQMVQSGIPASMLRLSTAIETETTLALAGHERLIGLLERALAIRRIGADKCMLIVGVTGRKAIAGAALKEAQIIARLQGGVRVGAIFGRQWLKSRFRAPYLRNTLWEMGYGVDTLETAVPWAAVPATIRDIESALRDALAECGEQVYVFTHLSHVYPHGSSVYTTYTFRLAADPEETLRRWRLMKDAASRAVIANRGTISHQHGVGTDHAPYLPAEKGPLGMAAIADVCRRFDPDGIMNPGKLFAGERTDA
jgi:alkyldihydroxyacetonephosphate synthase